MFDQVPFNHIEAIAQDTLAEFDFNVSRILFNCQIEIWCQQVEHARSFNLPFDPRISWEVKS